MFIYMFDVVTLWIKPRTSLEFHESRLDNHDYTTTLLKYKI